MLGAEVDVDEFYKGRMAAFGIERDIFKQYVHMVSPNKGELHLLDWEYRAGLENASAAINAKENEASNLDRATKEITHKKHELKSLRAQQENRIAQIQRLSELSHPVERDTTYLVPDRFASTEAMNLYSGVLVANTHAVNSQDNTATAQKKSSKMIKTLRTTEIMHLEAKIEEETRKIKGKKSELDMALKEVNLGSSALDTIVAQSLEKSKEEASALISEVDKLDYQGYLAVAELLHLRLKIMKAQREEIEELAQLRADKEYFSHRERNMREQLISDMALMKKRLRAEATNSTKDFHEQFVHLEALLHKLKKRGAVLEEDVHKHEGSSDQLKQAAEHAKNRYMKLRTRHSLEMEGFHNEAKMLKGQLKKLEQTAAKMGVRVE
jgi:hypothetical protein